MMIMRILTATDLTALISFLLSRFFTILLTCVICMLLLNLMSLIQIPARCIQSYRLILCIVTSDLSERLHKNIVQEQHHYEI